MTADPRRRATLAALLGAALAGRRALADDTGTRIRAGGALKFAVYKNFFPFSDQGEGIDVDLAQALAARLGMRADLLPFDAGESMSDDFRNMVWKGHYLGYGPADVLMHVPQDRVLATRNEQVSLFGPYLRERVQLAIDESKTGPWQGLDVFARERVAVDGGSISAQAMLGAEGGRYRDQVVIGRDIHEALAALLEGRAAALMATHSEIEAGLADAAARYRIIDPQLPTLPQRGWVVGMAVRRQDTELAAALQQGLDALRADGSLARIFERRHLRYVEP
jgi:ABC-type amino acid transport substrate-binding protein